MEAVKDVSSFHCFTPDEKAILQNSLLAWFDIRQRDLPWRKISTDDQNKRAYAVWVSEIMLQQTQVATVIDYYERWMKKWPTVQDLAEASVEEVNTMWSGLGYYSRGRRLLEGAQKVVQEFDGEVPKTAQDLQKMLPGVGRYTAGAIASIAFGEVTGLVDGNVMRVLARLRMIGASITLQTVIDELWSIANDIVDPNRPGDFNQSMMELGATVCTPKNPTCSQCPIKSLCRAYAKVEERSITALVKTSQPPKKKADLLDIECLVPDCKLCLPTDQPWDKSLGVHNFPRKPKKAEARHENHNVLVIVGMENKSTKEQYLICQRPKKGLLAGLWEFPMKPCCDSDKKPKSILSDDFNIDPATVHELQDCGMVSHIFSHVQHTYHIYSMKLREDKMDLDVFGNNERKKQWITDGEIEDIAMSTGMRKVFKIYKDKKNNKKGNKRKTNGEVFEDRKKQPSISSYFMTTGK